MKINLWLDDVRPAPPDFVHVKTVPEAQEILTTKIVEFASLDHDLGLCEKCAPPDELIIVQNINCAHNGTGYDLCKWMAETGNWPENKPQVHSANPVGRQNMISAINRYFSEKNNG